MVDQQIFWYLLVVNLIAYVIGVSMNAFLGRLFSYPVARLIFGGVVAVLLLNACVLFLLFSSLEGPFLSGIFGVDGFFDSVEKGNLVGQLIGPGLLFLSAIWAYVVYRSRSGANNDNKGAAESGGTLIVAFGNKVATVIFWVIGGGFLLFAVVGLIASRI